MRKTFFQCSLTLLSLTTNYLHLHIFKSFLTYFKNKKVDYFLLLLLYWFIKISIIIKIINAKLSIFFQNKFGTFLTKSEHIYKGSNLQ